jgi:hypothetical protein
MYTKSVLDDLPIAQPEYLPFTIPNAEAWIAPPVIGDLLEAPQIYIWSGKITAGRKTMAGGSVPTIGTTSGFRIWTYEMGIFIKYMMPNDLELEDNIFPLIVDSVMEKLQSVNLPVAITDTTVGARPSHITHFGQDMDVWYGNIHSAGDERFWTYEAEIRNTIRESLQQ